MKALTPAGLSFGPLLMFLGLQPRGGWYFVTGLLGAGLLGVGLATIYLSVSEPRQGE